LIGLFDQRKAKKESSMFVNTVSKGLSVSFVAVVALCLMVTSVWADTKQDWAKYDLAKMTIVYPEETAATNPPWLLWQPDPEAASYRVSLKGASDQGPWVIDRNFYLPEEFLPVGIYQLKVQALDAEGKVLGEPSSFGFQVPEPISDTPPKLNHIKRNGKADLLAKDGFLRNIQNATGFKEKLRDRLIDYASKPDEKLIVPITLPERYEDGVWNHDLWQKNYSNVGAIEQRVLALTVVWEITGEQKYFDEALEIVRVTDTWEADGATGVWENDHSAQSTLYTLSLFLDSTKDVLEKKDRDQIVKAISERCADVYGLLNPLVPRELSAGVMNDPDNNHPWFSTASLIFGSLALLDEDPRAEEWLAYGTQLYWGVFLSKGGRDGGWHEGIDYWSYTLFFVLQFSNARANNTDVNFFEHPWLKNTTFFKMYVHPPVGGFAPFGDTHYLAPKGFDALVVGGFASQTGDPLAWKYFDAVMEGKEYKTIRDVQYSLLWFDRSKAEGKEIQEIPFATHFRDIGWVVSNSDLFDEEDQVFFAMRCGPYFGRVFGHSHADLNHFVITAGGEKLLWDGGWYDGYLGPHHRNYSRLSEAHNTLLIDGTGQVVHTAGIDGKITDFEVEDEVLKVTGDASKPFIYGARHYKFNREFEYKNKSEWTIKDDIGLREKAYLSLMFHSAYPIVYHSEDNSFIIKGEKYQLKGQVESDVPLIASLSDAYEFEPKPNGRHKSFPKRYHLELKTAKQIDEIWKPVTHLKLTKIAN
jgi:uncharacterized protein DUF4962/heparinase II/III-like protein